MRARPRSPSPCHPGSHSARIAKSLVLPIMSPGAPPVPLFGRIKDRGGAGRRSPTSYLVRILIRTAISVWRREIRLSFGSFVPESHPSGLVAARGVAPTILNRCQDPSISHHTPWGGDPQAFVRLSVRRHRFDSGGGMFCRDAAVRERRIDGLGKKANRFRDARVLGPVSIIRWAKTYLDWERRILATARPATRTLRLLCNLVIKATRRVRTGKEREGGALARVRGESITRG